MKRTNDPVAAALGRCVARNIRARAKATSTTLADASRDAFGDANLLNVMLYQYTHIRKVPNVLTLAKLADALGCDLPDLVPTRAEVLTEMAVRR